MSEIGLKMRFIANWGPIWSASPGKTNVMATSEVNFGTYINGSKVEIEENSTKSIEDLQGVLATNGFPEHLQKIINDEKLKLKSLRATHSCGIDYAGRHSSRNEG